MFDEPVYCVRLAGRGSRPRVRTLYITSTKCTVFKTITTGAHAETPSIDAIYMQATQAESHSRAR